MKGLGLGAVRGFKPALVVCLGTLVAARPVAAPFRRELGRILGSVPPNVAARGPYTA
jgi:hypothetical protein